MKWEDFLKLHELVVEKSLNFDSQRYLANLYKDAVSAYLYRTNVSSELKVDFEWKHYEIWREFSRGLYARLLDRYYAPILTLEVDPQAVKTLVDEDPNIRRRADSDSQIEITLDGLMQPERLIELINSSYRYVEDQLKERERQYVEVFDDGQPLDREKLGRLIDFCGLSAYKDTLFAQTAPALWVRKQAPIGEKVAKGRSKLGGHPDLPLSLEWPMYQSHPLLFLAQINLAELPDFGAKSPLPAQGMLYFFALLDWMVDDIPMDQWEDPSLVRVLFYEGDVTALDENNLHRVFPTLPNHVPFLEAAVEFVTFLTLLDFAADKASIIPANQDNWQRVELQLRVDDLYKRFYGRIPQHWLLGYERSIQSSPIAEAHERLLFQVDYDEQVNFFWGDGGRIFFVISEQALENRAFEQVRFGSESS